jgi:hypothetical protein
MKLERNYLALLLLTAASCNQFAQKDSEVKHAINEPTPSEQIATKQNEIKKESVSRVVKFGDLRFTVRSDGDETLRGLKIATVNMKGDTTKTDTTSIPDIKGFLKDVVVGDLNKDGFPEVYCFTTSKGEDQSGSVYAITYLKDKAVSVDTKNINEQAEKADSFYLKAPYLMRTFADSSIKYTLVKHDSKFVLTSSK